MNLQASRSKFLEETIEHFTNNPRAVTLRYNDLGNSNYCTYSPQNGSKGCAIGRHIPNKMLCQDLDNLPVSGVNCDVVFEQLPEWLRSLGQDFLWDVQQLHDTNSNWNNGLTPLGLEFVSKIRAKHICDLETTTDTEQTLNQVESLTPHTQMIPDQVAPLD